MVGQDFGTTSLTLERRPAWSMGHIVTGPDPVPREYPQVVMAASCPWFWKTNTANPSGKPFRETLYFPGRKRFNRAPIFYLAGHWHFT